MSTKTKSTIQIIHIEDMRKNAYNRFMKIDVSHIAKLANLPLSKEEKEKFEKQLTETLSYIEELNQIDTKQLKTTPQVTELENILREDIVTASLTQEQALQNATSKHNGFFKVPAILENDL